MVEFSYFTRFNEGIYLAFFYQPVGKKEWLGICPV